MRRWNDSRGHKLGTLINTGTLYTLTLGIHVLSVNKYIQLNLIKLLMVIKNFMRIMRIVLNVIN